MKNNHLLTESTGGYLRTVPIRDPYWNEPNSRFIYLNNLVLTICYVHEFMRQNQ